MDQIIDWTLMTLLANDVIPEDVQCIAAINAVTVSQLFAHPEKYCFRQPLLRTKAPNCSMNMAFCQLHVNNPQLPEKK